jgi:hypothetical protein
MVYITHEMFLDWKKNGKNLQNAYREVHAFYSPQKEAIHFPAEHHNSIP